MALSVFLNRRLFRLIKISRNYFSPDRRLFRLAYVSRHYRYFYITVYFGSAKVSRHRYSSHIIDYLVTVDCIGLTIYLGHQSPGKDKEANWLPAPAGNFSIWLRTYWPDKAILDGTWKPPVVLKGPPEGTGSRALQ
jgi:hypothetical protein